MTNEHQPNGDMGQSSPVEQMIPLVKSESPEPEKSVSAKAPFDNQIDNQTQEGEGSEPLEPTELKPIEMDRYECRSCGYTYEPAKGDSRSRIAAGIEFNDLPADWRCPVCGSSRTQFSNVGPQGTASGFKENLSYGFGVNKLTPGQKSVLIFGALGIAVLFFLSLYGLQ